jgi:hypothetical protein
LTLATLTVAPGTPTNLVAARVNDTQTSLVWTNNYPSNGVPTVTNVAQSVNGGAYQGIASIGLASSVTLPTVGNRKTVYIVSSNNSAGGSANSAPSAPVFTRPADPSGAAAARQGQDIVLTWVNNVAYAEYQVLVYHGVQQTDGTIVWDGAADGWTTDDAMVALPAGTTTYTHTAPNPAQVHVYAIGAFSTATPRLASTGTSRTQPVQLMAPPLAPRIVPLPPFWDYTKAIRVDWVHNPVDSSGQAAGQIRYSTDGGQTWTLSSKFTNSYQYALIGPVGQTYIGQTLQFQARTWGAMTTGGADGTGASPWSTTVSTTLATAPTLTITAPTDGTVITTSSMTVALGFAQPEGATAVQATIELWDGSTLVESLPTTTIAGTNMGTRLLNGESYTIRATVIDSNGLTATATPVVITVTYIDPVAAVVTVKYLPDSGMAQLDIDIPAATAGLADAVALTVARTIDGTTETVVLRIPVSVGRVSIMDTTPTINGTNVYTVTTYSIDDEAFNVTATLTTNEEQWAFLSSGPGYAQWVSFYGSLTLGANPTREMALVPTAGRSRPIALFGREGTIDVSGTAQIVRGEGSTPEEIEAFALTAGRACYRDPSGRRMFGAVNLSIRNRTGPIAGLSYTVSEAE